MLKQDIWDYSYFSVTNSKQLLQALHTYVTVCYVLTKGEVKNLIYMKPISFVQNANNLNSILLNNKHNYMYNQIIFNNRKTLGLVQ